MIREKKSASAEHDKADDIRVRSRNRVDIVGNWREIVKKYFPRASPIRTERRAHVTADACGGCTTIVPKYTRGAKSEANYKHAVSPGCQSSIRGIFFSGSIEQFYASSDNERMGASELGFNVFAVTGGFQRLTGKSSDERLTCFSRYSSAIKLPSTIPLAIKLVRDDTKPSERLRFGPRIIQ